jgi:pilus assembly protein CpaF
MPPVSPDGPHVSIRRFSRQALSMEQLVEWNSLTTEAANFLSALVEIKQNLVVAGGTGSGKTSFLNVLSAYIDPTERIIVIEDSRELQLNQPARGAARDPAARPPGAERGVHPRPVQGQPAHASRPHHHG